MTKEQIKLEAKRILDSLDVKLEEITNDIAQEIERSSCGSRFFVADKTIAKRPGVGSTEPL